MKFSKKYVKKLLLSCHILCNSWFVIIISPNSTPCFFSEHTNQSPTNHWFVVLFGPFQSNIFIGILREHPKGTLHRSVATQFQLDRSARGPRDFWDVFLWLVFCWGKPQKLVKRTWDDMMNQWCFLKLGPKNLKPVLRSFFHLQLLHLNGPNDANMTIPFWHGRKIGTE